LRLIAHPDVEKPPVVETYMHRLVCTNGLTIADPAAKISLRSKTPDNIFEELQTIMQAELDTMVQKLEDYANTANHFISGDRSLLIYNLAAERNLPRKLVSRAMDLGAELPAEASVYDILQIFTELAKEAKPNNAYKLQSLGGELASAHSEILHRCTTCERPITPNWDLV
jgi:hypothetical protein